jgi:magnesium-transporting ATPase (P-type)
MLMSDSDGNDTVGNPHALSAEEACAGVSCNPDGLTSAEARKRLETIGPNRLPAPPKEGLLKRFFKHFNDLLIYVLIAAAVITAIKVQGILFLITLSLAVFAIMAVTRPMVTSVKKAAGSCLGTGPG